MAAASMVDVMKYFEMKPAEFRAQWTKLSENDRTVLREGIGNGSFTY